MFWSLLIAVTFGVPAGIGLWVLGHLLWVSLVLPRWRRFVARRLGRQAVRTIDLSAAFAAARPVVPLLVLLGLGWAVLTVTRRK